MADQGLSFRKIWRLLISKLYQLLTFKLPESQQGPSCSRGAFSEPTPESVHVAVSFTLQHKLNTLTQKDQCFHEAQGQKQRTKDLVQVCFIRLSIIASYLHCVCEVTHRSPPPQTSVHGIFPEDACL